MEKISEKGLYFIAYIIFCVLISKYLFKFTFLMNEEEKLEYFSNKYKTK